MPQQSTEIPIRGSGGVLEATAQQEEVRELSLLLRSWCCQSSRWLGKEWQPTAERYQQLPGDRRDRITVLKQAQHRVHTAICLQ